MNRDSQIGFNHLHKLEALLSIHRHHQQRYARAGYCCAAQMHEHEIDVRVAFGDLLELWNKEGVTADVDAADCQRVGQREDKGSSNEESTHR